MQADKKSTNKRLGLFIIIGIAFVGLFLAIFLILGILAAIAIPAFVKNVEKAKVAIIENNVSSAIGTSNILYTEGSLSSQDICSQAIKDLNNAGTPDDTSDDLYSPYDNSIPAFSFEPQPGVITLTSDGTSIVIKGYSKDLDVLFEEKVP